MPIARAEAYQTIVGIYKQLAEDDVPIHPVLVHEIGIPGTTLLADLIKHQLKDPTIETAGGWFPLPQETTESHNYRIFKRLVRKQYVRCKPAEGITPAIWVDYAKMELARMSYERRHRGRKKAGWCDLNLVFLDFLSENACQIENGDESPFLDLFQKSVRRLQRKGLVRVRKAKDGTFWVRGQIERLFKPKGTCQHCEALNTPALPGHEHAWFVYDGYTNGSGGIKVSCICGAEGLISNPTTEDLDKAMTSPYRWYEPGRVVIEGTHEH